MPSRRSRTRHSSSKLLGGQRPFWQQVLALLALVPLVVGALLILTTLTGLLVWSGPREQVIMGACYILLSFALSNALQKQWTLVAGWLLMGVAIWLGTHWTHLGLRIFAAAWAGVGVMLISKKFFQQRRQYLDQKAR